MKDHRTLQCETCHISLAVSLTAVSDVFTGGRGCVFGGIWKLPGTAASWVWETSHCELIGATNRRLHPADSTVGIWDTELFVQLVIITNTHTHTHTHTVVIGIREMDEEPVLTRGLNVSSLTLWEKNKQWEESKTSKTEWEKEREE